MYKSTSRFQQAQLRTPSARAKRAKPNAMLKHKKTVVAYLATQGIHPRDNSRAIIKTAYTHFGHKLKSDLRTDEQITAALGHVVTQIRRNSTKTT